MTLTKDAITLSIFDRLDLSKAASAKAVETTIGCFVKRETFSRKGTTTNKA